MVEFKEKGNVPGRWRQQMLIKTKTRMLQGIELAITIPHDPLATVSFQ